MVHFFPPFLCVYWRANSVEKQQLNFRNASVLHCFRNSSLTIIWNNLGLLNVCWVCLITISWSYNLSDWLHVLTKPTKYMTYASSVRMVHFFPLCITRFHRLHMTTLKAVRRIRHQSESDRLLAKLFAIQLNESFSRSTAFIGHNTWQKTN